MIIKPLSQRAQNILFAPIVIPLAVVVVPIVLVMMAAYKACEWIGKKLDPPVWRRWFALWPAECDPWPDGGFNGWVWLEMIWRNPAAPGWTKYRRELPPEPQEDR